jgi:hypothetical protein
MLHLNYINGKITGDSLLSKIWVYNGDGVMELVTMYFYVQASFMSKIILIQKFKWLNKIIRFDLYYSLIYLFKLICIDPHYFMLLINFN